MWPLVDAADILVIDGPLWLGDNSSITRQLIERLYAMSGLFNEKGQYVSITGWPPAHSSRTMRMASSTRPCPSSTASSTLATASPLAADDGWIGGVGPGPSYLDPGSGGPENDFTNRNTTFMTWNLLHTARMLKDAGGIPANGNLRQAWNDGERFGFDANPE